MPDFRCWVPIVRIAILDVFWAQWVFFARMASFSFFFLQIITTCMPDSPCSIHIVKMAILEIVWAQTIFPIFGQNGFIFLSFSLNNKKMYVRFPLLNSSCKDSYFGVFGVQPKIFDFWPEWLHFPFWFSKKIDARFPQLSSYCKNSYFGGFWAQVKMFDFWPVRIHFFFFRK